MKLIRISLLVVPLMFLTGWSHTPPSDPQTEDTYRWLEEQRQKQRDEERQFRQQQEEERRHRELLDEIRKLQRPGPPSS